MAFVAPASSFTGTRVIQNRPRAQTAPPRVARVATAATTVRASASTMATGVKRNVNLEKLQAGYLFPEIGRRRAAYLAENPGAEIISLGIGDTTMPIPSHVCAALQEAAKSLGTVEGYSGYGDGNGNQDLREAIADVLYGGKVSADEVFVDDGAKCAISRLQQVFGPAATVAVQDPSYPVYVDTAVMMGQTGLYNDGTSQFKSIAYMECTVENDFFPDLSKVERTDIIFFCSPNNPTGAAATRAQLKSLVAFAKKNGSIIVYDAAYAPFIRSPHVPKSIYEVDGARECAVEVNSFSKHAGFTGVRLGWTIVPDDIKFADGSSVKADYSRIMATCFNGASNIAQAGGMAILSSEGQKEVEDLIDYYLGNAKMLKDTMTSLGINAYAASDAPYVWVAFPGKKSWDVFSDILSTAQVVTIPGAGFGPGGEGYLRLSAFAPRESCIKACDRLKKMFGKYASVAESVVEANRRLSTWYDDYES
jgi:LL-diaminopimelate aminotransferase